MNLTPSLKPWVNKCGSTFWVCGWNPSVWPFKWKLLSSTFKWCCLILTILQNDIQHFSPSFKLSTLGSERINNHLSPKLETLILLRFSSNNTMSNYFDFIERKIKRKLHTYRFNNVTTSIVRKYLRNFTRYLQIQQNVI